MRFWINCEAEMNLDLHALWLEYFETCRMEIWSKLMLDPNGHSEADKLGKIDKIIHSLIYPGEGVYFEGDG